MSRAKRPLSRTAVKKANSEFYANHPELKGKPLNGKDPKQARLRREWMTLYKKNSGKIEKASDEPQKTCTDTTEKCAAKELKAWREKHKDAIEQALKDQKKMLQAKRKELKRGNDDDKANFKKWFGTNDPLTDEEDRDIMKEQIDDMLKLNEDTSIDNFYPAEEDKPDDPTYAYVYPADDEHKIYLDKKFHDAPATGKDSKAGVLTHEMSHFEDIAGTDDHEYGSEDCKESAKNNPDEAKDNADNWEYYMEGID